MQVHHLLEAIRATAHEYERTQPAITQALRGIVARAERFEAHEELHSKKEWQLPAPPAGRQWHRNDGWTQADLPDGFRPLMADELDGGLYADIQWKPSLLSKWQTEGEWHAEGTGWFRTTRA